MEYKLGDMVSKKDPNFYEKYVDIAEWCNTKGSGYILMKDSENETYTIVDPSTFENQKKKSLLIELNEIINWFDKHHYIAEKIAYGRATREEYSDIIAQMDNKAERINEIRNLLRDIPK